MVYQNKIFSFTIKGRAKNLFPSDVERTIDTFLCLVTVIPFEIFLYYLAGILVRFIRYVFVLSPLNIFVLRGVGDGAGLLVCTLTPIGFKIFGQYLVALWIRSRRCVKYKNEDSRFFAF